MIEPPLAPGSRASSDWLQRHPHPTSFILHMIGIPPTFLGVLVRSDLPLPALGAALPAGPGPVRRAAFSLQFAGPSARGDRPRRDHLLQAEARAPLRGVPRRHRASNARPEDRCPGRTGVIIDSGTRPIRLSLSRRRRTDRAANGRGRALAPDLGTRRRAADRDAGSCGDFRGDRRHPPRF